ncbi:hypothetical protein [Jiangella endophytica]|uniref:hypothetical protein n=1 Tax=Jiangella endophytica TaxID=1623398 RepID=UPI000E34EFFA|nr:hypothetical protein [Jiangella endophytica]
MTADLEFGATDDPGTKPPSRPPVRTPAMRAYCATLARFTSSVQSTEQLLRNDDAGTREDTEQREQTAAIRLRGIDRAGTAATDGLAHCAAVRSEHGLPAHVTEPDRPPAAGASADLPQFHTPDDAPFGDPSRHADLDAPRDDTGHFSGDDPGRGTLGGVAVRAPHGVPAAGRPGSAVRAGPGSSGSGSSGAATAVRAEPAPLRTPAARLDDPAPGLDRLRRTGGADLGVALTALGRRRDELKLAETDFAAWLDAHDERSRRVTLGAVVGAGLCGAAVMAVAGSRLAAAAAFALLIVCTLAVVAVGLGVAAARRLPRVCRGAGLSRRPDASALARYGTRIGGAALLALTAANIAAGAL